MDVMDGNYKELDGKQKKALEVTQTFIKKMHKALLEEADKNKQKLQLDLKSKTKRLNEDLDELWQLVQALEKDGVGAKGPGKGNNSKVSSASKGSKAGLEKKDSKKSLSAVSEGPSTTRHSQKPTIEVTNEDQAPTNGGGSGNESEEEVHLVDSDEDKDKRRDKSKDKKEKSSSRKENREEKLTVVDDDGENEEDDAS